MYVCCTYPTFDTHLLEQSALYNSMPKPHLPSAFVCIIIYTMNCRNNVYTRYIARTCDSAIYITTVSSGNVRLIPDTTIKREVEGRSPKYTGLERLPGRYRSLSIYEADFFPCVGVWGPSLPIPLADLVGEF